MENATAVSFGQKQVVRWTIAEGKLHVSLRNGASRVFDPAELPGAVRQHAELHGLKQRLADSYAGAKEEGLTADDIEARVDALWQGLHDDWTSRQETGGMLAAAIAKVTGQDLAKVIERLKGMEKADIRKLEANGKVAEVLAAMRRERNAGKGISDDELENLF